jgi:hypothetical protein
MVGDGRSRGSSKNVMREPSVSSQWLAASIAEGSARYPTHAG